MSHSEVRPVPLGGALCLLVCLAALSGTCTWCAVCVVLGGGVRGEARAL